MPIRKRNKDDFMSREMDERLSEMEASISNVYQQAVEETTARLNLYMQAYEEENRVMRARLIEGEITEKEYEEWARRNLLRTQQYSTTIDSLTEMLVNADTAAIALVNGELPYVIAESYNYTQFVGHIIADHDDIPNVSFEIYNAQSVQAIIRDNPQILPVVDPELDTEWNRTRLNREITQGIIQGSTIPDMATRLQRVTQMDRNSAIRAARTAMTGAENMGRNESHRRITSQGINMVKRWSSTYDARTRDTHRLLDNTTANEKGLFGEGILDKLDEPLMEFPGDPKGAAAEIYNCRCRLNVVPPNYSREANAQAYERWMQENYPADYNALNNSNYFDRLHKTDEWTAEAQQRVDRRIERLREAEGQPTFRTATNRQEANEVLQSMGIQIPATTSKIDEDVYISVTNQLSSLNSRFGVIGEGYELRVRNDRNAGEAASFGTKEGNHIYLNGRYYYRRSDLESMMQDCTSRGHCMPYAPEYADSYVITHEYGHALQRDIIGDVSASVRGTVQDHHMSQIIFIARERNPDFDLEANLSVYAHKSKSEFFAEVFANSQCGQPNELGLAMQEWLRRQGYDS